MGVSGPIAVVILVAALLSQGSALLTAQRNADTRIEDGREAWQRRHEAMLAQGFTADTGSWNNGQKIVTLRLTNTGRVALDVARLDVFFDGAWANLNITSARVEGIDTDVWTPATELVLLVTWPVRPSDAAVVSEWGQAAFLRGV